MSTPDRPILVTRCVCTGHDFAAALRVARSLGAGTVAELQRQLSISTGCGLCIPYLQRTLESGATGHPLLEEREVAAFLERSGVVLHEESGQEGDHE